PLLLPLLPSFPTRRSSDLFELGGQLRRAAFSVPVNIVEGFAHSAGRARLNFLNIAQASLAEVGYCIHVAWRLGYISEADANELEDRKSTRLNSSHLGISYA